MFPSIIISGLDDMCGRHSIWRRWGRYEGQVEMFLLINLYIYYCKGRLRKYIKGLSTLVLSSFIC